MPRCVNDAKANYKGDEPSPKGLGFCAHAEKVGAVREGRDKGVWVVQKAANGVRRWVRRVVDKRYKVDAMAGALTAALEDGWRRLAAGALIVIYRDGSRAAVEGKIGKGRGTAGAARLAEMRELHLRHAADPAVKAIVFSGAGREHLEAFVRHLLTKASYAVITDILMARESMDEVLSNFASMFKKTRLRSAKDYTFRAGAGLDPAKVARRLKL